MVLLDDRVALTLLKVTTVRRMPINTDLVSRTAVFLAVETKWSFSFSVKDFYPVRLNQHLSGDRRLQSSSF